MTNTKQFNEVLTKISYVFKKGIYVLENQFILPNEKSDDELVGSFALILTDKCKDALTEVLGETEEAYAITDVKAAKTNIEGYYFPIQDADVIKNYNSQLDAIFDEFENEEEFDVLNLSEQDYEAFISGDTIRLANPYGSDLEINKSMFPLLTEKNIKNFHYMMKDDENSVSTTLSVWIDTDWFTIYDNLMYINLVI